MVIPDWFADTNSVFLNIIAAAIVYIIGFLAKKFRSTLFGRRQILSISIYAIVIVLFLIALFVLLIVHVFTNIILASLLAIAIFVYLTNLVLSGARNTGISRIYDTTEIGIGFRESLDLANGNFSFLGMGAAKLTELETFTETLKRCGRNGNQARFLLADSNAPLLKELEKKNGVPQGAYSKRIDESVSKIERIATEFSLDVEIRRYNVSSERDLQLFRILLINEKIAIISWTVWNRGEGRENPQLICTRVESEGAGDDKSAYKAFSDFFERIWNDPTTEIHYEKKKND